MPPSLTCASVSPPILLPSMRCVRMKAWTGNTEAEQEQRLLRGFVLSLPQPSGLVVAPATCGALGLSRLSEEQRASEEPFCLSTPPRQAERATHGQDLPALPPCKHPCGSNTHYPAPRTPTKLLDKLSQHHCGWGWCAALLQTPFAVAQWLPPKWGGCFAQPLSSSARLFPHSGNMQFSLLVL